LHKKWFAGFMAISLIFTNLSLFSFPTFAEESTFEYVGQDSLFHAFTTPDTEIGVADPTASDGKTSRKILKEINGWDFQLRMNKGIFTNDYNGNSSGTSPLVSWKKYDLYARVKVDFNDETFSSEAFKIGVYSITTGNSRINELSVPLSSLKPNEWADIKVGTYLPSLTDYELIYLAPPNNVNHVINAIYVDKFYFKEAPLGDPAISLDSVSPNTPISNGGGALKISATTTAIPEGELLDVKVLNSSAEQQMFEIQQQPINKNTAAITIQVPQFTQGGTYSVELGYKNAPKVNTTFEVSKDSLIVIDQVNGSPDSYSGGTISVNASTLNIADFETLQAQVMDAKGNDVTQTSGFTFLGNTVSNNAVVMSVQVPPSTTAGTYKLRLSYGNTSHEASFLVGQPPTLMIGMIKGDPVASANGGQIDIPVMTQKIQDHEQLTASVRNESGQVQNFVITGTEVISGKANMEVQVPASTAEGLYTIEIKYGLLPATNVEFMVTSHPYIKINGVLGSPVPHKGGEVQIPVTSVYVADGKKIAVTIKNDAGADVTESLSFGLSGNTIKNNAADIRISVPGVTPEGKYKVELEAPDAAKREASFVVGGTPSADILPVTGSPVPYSGGMITIPITTMNIRDNGELSITVTDGTGADLTSLFTITGNKVAANQANVKIIVPPMRSNQESNYKVNVHYDASLLGSTQFRVTAHPGKVTGDYMLEDNLFTYRNGASSTVDSTATDGHAARMPGNSTGRDVQYSAWDFSMLKTGAPYDVYFKIKVDQKTGSSGNAFKMGVYDATQQKELLPAQIIPVSDTQGGQWKEFRLGTFNPNYGVNLIEFYVEGMGNENVSSIYLDHILLKEVVPHVIQNDEFVLSNNATHVPDGLTPDNKATKVQNGGNVNVPAVEIPIDGEELVAGDYNMSLLVHPDRVPGTDWDNAVGDVMGLSVINVTTGEVIAAKQVYGTENSFFNYKMEYFGGIQLPITINPSHEYRVKIYSTKNANSFPSFRIDSLTLTKKLPETHYNSNKYNTVYPYKISPANQDGINDFATIYYHGSPGKTIHVIVYDEEGNAIKRLVTGREDGANVQEKWDGTDDKGNTVANGLYTIEVKRSDDTIVLRRNIQVITGVQLTKATVNPALNHFPKGVWYEAGNIPFNKMDAAAYLDRTFKDISDSGADTVYLSNWHGKPDIYEVTLEKAAQYGLKLIGLPDGHDLFKFWDGNFWDSESLYSNDEFEMYNALVELTNKALLTDHAEQLAGYLLWDEPRVLYAVKKERFRDNLSVLRRMLESIDPQRFTVIDYTMPEDAEYFYPSNLTQSLTYDSYPAGNLYPTPGNFKHTGAYPNASYEEGLDATTLQIRKNLTNDAPLWMILQAFGDGGLFREPIPSEIRAMTYEAIGRGARGFTYFMYQATLNFRGMVDYDYSHRPHIYDTIKQLYSELDAIKPTILDMRRIANVATTTGGGGGATVDPVDPGYPSADITTHESISSPDKYLVVVNHNAEEEDKVTITIDRAKLGMNVQSIVEVSKQDGSGSEVGFQTTADSYIISDMNFAAGDGKIFKLVKERKQIVKEVQDDRFGIEGAGSARGIADISASDSKTAMKVIGDSNGPKDFYAYTSDADLTVGKTYEVYARVKVNYKTALVVDVTNGPSFPKPEGDAFTVGLDFSAGGSALEPTVIPASSMENMFWTDVKVGRIEATTVNIAQQAAAVYVSPANNKENIESIYVDKFYFVEAGEHVSIELGNPDPQVLVPGTSGTVTIPVTTAGIMAGESLTVTVKNSSGITQNFAVTGITMQTNKGSLAIAVPATADKGVYTVEISYGDTKKTATFQISDPGSNDVPIMNTGITDSSLKVTLSPQQLKELLEAAKPDKNGIINLELDYTKNEAIQEVQLTFTGVSEWLAKLDERVNMVVKTDFGTVKVNAESIRKLAKGADNRITFIIRKGSLGSFIIECLVNDKAVDWSDDEYPLVIEVKQESKPGENSDYIVASRESGGTTTILSQSVYANGKMTFRTTEIGTFAVLSNEKLFTDTKGHWSDKAVKYMAARDVVKGTGNNRFLPDGTVTRADFVTMLVRMLGLKGATTDSFSDVSDSDYFAKEIAIAKAFELIKGTGNNEFKPRETITRQEMFVIVERAMRKIGMLHEEADNVSNLDQFKDADAISGYARGSISTLYAKGLVNGFAGNLLPGKHSTRAEAAQFLMNVLVQMK